MRFDVVTLFPQMFAALDCGISGRALKRGLALDRAHRTVSAGELVNEMSTPARRGLLTVLGSWLDR